MDTSTPKSTLSEFNVEVVRIGEIEKHPNADTLSITKVNGNPVIIKTDSFKTGDLAVYVPVDAIVPLQNPAFAFLKSPRIKAARLRGVYSEGLLVPVAAAFGSIDTSNLKPGDNVQEVLGITKHLSAADRAELMGPPNRTGAKRGGAKNPPFMPVYGLDALKRMAFEIKPGTPVVLTEKIHGCNARYCYRNGRFYVGSHKTMRSVGEHVLVEWLKRSWLGLKSAFGLKHRAHVYLDHGDVWVKVAKTLSLEEKLKKAPGLVFYGEVYGEGLQKRGGIPFVYDSPAGHSFRVFDIYDPDAKVFLSYTEMVHLCRDLGLRTAPFLRLTTFQNVEELDGMSRGPSELNEGHMREGFVLRTDLAARDPARKTFKYVSEDYKLLGGGDD